MSDHDAFHDGPDPAIRVGTNPANSIGNRAVVEALALTLKMIILSDYAAIEAKNVGRRERRRSRRL